MNNIFEIKNNFASLEKVSLIPIIEGENDGEITISIPTCKRSDMLKETLDSVFCQQSSLSFSVTVVDNNPERNDETELLINSSYRDYKNLSYYKNEANLGMTGNWNRLFQICKTKYMIMLHDDDVLMPGFLNQIISCLDLISNISAINSGKLIWYGDESQKNIIAGYSKVYLYSAKSNYPYYNFGPPSGCLFNVKDVMEAGGFDNETYPAIDYVLIEKLCLIGKTIGRMDGHSMLYRTGRNESSKLETMIGWLRIDNQIKEELGNILNIRKLHKTIVKFFELKVMMWAIEKKMFGDRIKYMPYNLLFIVCLRIYRHFCNQQITKTYRIVKKES